MVGPAQEASKHLVVSSEMNLWRKTASYDTFNCRIESDLVQLSDPELGWTGHPRNDAERHPLSTDRPTIRRGTRIRSSRSSDMSSSSSSSDVDSGDSSDDAVPHNVPTPTKLQRLRRIFLSKPTRPRAAASLSSRPRSPTVVCRIQKLQSRQHHSAAPRRIPRSASFSRSEDGDANNQSTSSSEEEEEEEKETLKQPCLSIDKHVHTLCEQVKRLTVARESTTTQMHSVLDDAIEELQFLQKREERALQLQIQQIEEVRGSVSSFSPLLSVVVASLSDNQSFALRLEVFEQQYVAKVADIQREMHAAIQQERTRAEGAICAAAEALQIKTKRAAVSAFAECPGFSTDVGDWSAKTTTRPSRNATTAPSKLQSMPSSRTLGWRSGRRLETLSPAHANDADDKSDTHEALSPVSRQRAKLRALEARLALFSQDSVDRITHELQKTEKRPSSSRSSSLQKQTSWRPPESVQNVASCDASSPLEAARRAWKPAPLSPLRKNRSYWRNGVSFERPHSVADDSRLDRLKTHAEAESSGRRDARDALSSRYLRPEEEEELRHLKNSIGLAKDWMEEQHR